MAEVKVSWIVGFVLIELVVRSMKGLGKGVRLHLHSRLN